MQQLKLPLNLLCEDRRIHKVKLTMSQPSILTRANLRLVFGWLKERTPQLHTVVGVTIYGVARAWTKTGEKFFNMQGLNLDSKAFTDLEAEKLLFKDIKIGYVAADDILEGLWDVDKDIHISYHEYDSVLRSIQSLRSRVPKEELFDRVCGALGFRYQGHVMQMIFENYYKMVEYRTKTK